MFPLFKKRTKVTEIKVLDLTINSTLEDDYFLPHDIKQELLKRFYKPIYIPIITIFCSFLIIYSKNKIQYNRNKNFIFVLTFFLLIFSEASLRYSISSDISLITYLLIPWVMFFSAYLIFHRMAKNV